MNRFYVLLETNDAYAPLAGTSLYSLFKNNQDLEGLTVYLIDDGISPENKEKYLRLAEEYGRELNFIDPEPMEKILRQNQVSMYKGSYTTYYKLFAVNLLLEDAQKVLFLDSDTVVDGSLQELTSWDFHGAPMAMTWEMVPEKYKVHLGLKADSRFFNGGAILFNVPVWREMQCEKKYLDYMKEYHPHFLFADQELSNVLFHDQIQLLPLKYNLHTSYFLYPAWQLKKIYRLHEDSSYTAQEIEEAKKHPVVYHFVGNTAICRPWHTNNHSPLTPVFDRYLREGPWRDYQKAEMKRGLMGRIQYGLYKMLPKSLYAEVHHAMLLHWLTHAERA